MEHFYSNDIGVQMLIYILKKKNIRRIVASPGTGNMFFVGSVQEDDFFEMYSCVDERSAAYMACGMCTESGEPVVLSCTGATASRNYFPALTESYYRKLPLLVVTASQRSCNAGHLITQYIDRSVQPIDTVEMSVHLPIIKDKEDEWDCNVKLNQAILELLDKKRPVHINMPSGYDLKFSHKNLNECRIINRYNIWDDFPTLGEGKRIAIVIGAHERMDVKLGHKIDIFCSKYNAVVFCDHTSGYYGKYRVQASLIASQEHYISEIFNIDVLIHLGEQLGDLYLYEALKNSKEVWRVSLEGRCVDTYKKLTKIFSVREGDFFDKYLTEKSFDKNNDDYLTVCNKELKHFLDNIPDVPFSNVWIAKKASTLLPNNCTVYLSILNTLRSWNFFPFSRNVYSFSNVGGFGIDGGLSTLIGASLVHRDRNYFCIAGDLQFFYDMNVCGNRHLQGNVRILLINNGKGSEFRLYTHGAEQMLGDDADKFIAAAGHFGNKSKDLAKNYVTSLQFEYLCAESKEEFVNQCAYFFDDKIHDKPLVFEVFTNNKDESNALYALRNIECNVVEMVKHKGREAIKSTLGEKGVKIVKRLTGK